MELTIEQQRALARARARARMKAQPPPVADTMSQDDMTSLSLGGGTTPANAAPSPQAPQPEERGSLIDPIMQGIGFGLPDEAAGIVSGAIDWMGLGPEGDKGTFSGGYDRTTKEWRGDLEAYRDRNPMLSTAAEIGGALATLPVTGALNVVRAPAALSRVAPLASRASNAVARGAAATANSAATGAAYGGLYGFGTAEGGLANRAVGAGEGAAMGAAVGAAAPAVMGAAKKTIGPLIGGAASKIRGPFKGTMNAKGVAERQVVETAKKDAAARGISLDEAIREIEIARANGVPRTSLDVGHGTRELGQQAANVSPQGKAVLNDLIDNRFETQIDRIVDVITRFAPGVNSPAKRKLLEAASRRARQPLYDRAYQMGENGVWNRDIEQLTYAPAMRQAIKDAGATGANKAAVEGVRPPKNPFVENADGTLSMQRGVLPNLRFWDAVKQNLDGQIGAAKRAGDNGAVRDLVQIKQKLVAQLDDAVPLYRDARGVAAEFFGADDALTAGEAFVRRTGDNAGAREAIAQMTPAERQLFGEGFATKLIDDLRNVRDRQTITNQVMQTPAARERLTLALGPDAARELQAALDIESLLDLGRKAIQGGARDRYADVLSALGAAGIGTGAMWMTTGELSPKALLIGALTAGSVALGRRGYNAVRSGANEKIMREIAEQLASGDPETFRRAVQRISRNPRLLESLRTGHERLTRALLPLVSKSQPLEITVHPQFTNDGGSQPAQAEGDGN